MKNYIIISVATLLLFSSCYISKDLPRDVKVSFNSDFPINSVQGPEGFIARYSNEELKQSYIDGLKSELEDNKVIIVEQGAEFEVTIEKFSTEESADDETVDDTNSDENGTTFTLTSINNKSNGSIKKSDGTSLGTWAAFKNRNEKLKDRTKKDGTTTHWERDFDDDAALRFAEKAGRRAGARIINDIHAYFKNQQ